MFIMTMLILKIDYVQYVMDLLEGVLNAVDEVVSMINFKLDMS